MADYAVEVSLGGVAGTALSGVFNVLDYDATKDGTTDDAAAIQAAVTACAAAGGGEVFFPAGTYNTDSVITISGDDISVRGQTGSIISTSGGHSAINIAHGCSNISIHGMSFTTTETDTDNFVQGRASIDINPAASTPHPTGIIIANCTFYDNFNCGVSGELLDDIVVDSCVFKNVAEHAIYFAAGSTNCVISNNILDGTNTDIQGGNGVKIAGAATQYVTVTGNVISGFSTNGVIFEYCVGNGVIANNVLRGNRVGVRIGCDVSLSMPDTSGYSVVGNVFVGSTLGSAAVGWGEISIDVEAGETASDINVTGNTFIGSSSDTYSRILRKHNGVGSGTITNMNVYGNLIGGTYAEFANYNEFNAWGNAGMSNAPGGYGQEGGTEIPALTSDTVTLTPVSAAPTPAEGMIYYDSDDNKLLVYTGAGWETITSA